MRQQTSQMVGQRFGSLDVVGFAGNRVTARCSCGSERDYDARDMRRGRIISCGCKPFALSARHPKAFRAWWGAIQRCHNENDKAYKTYGGVGVGVALEWRESFAAFFAHIGDPPTPEHTLDRYPDPFGNYEPGNVRWATLSEQQRNTRRNHEIWKSGMSAEEIKRKRVNAASKKYQAKRRAS